MCVGPLMSAGCSSDRGASYFSHQQGGALQGHPQVAGIQGFVFRNNGTHDLSLLCGDDHQFDGFYSFARARSWYDEVMSHHNFTLFPWCPSSSREGALHSQGRQLSKYDFAADVMSLGVRLGTGIVWSKVVRTAPEVELSPARYAEREYDLQAVC